MRKDVYVADDLRRLALWSGASSLRFDGALIRSKNVVGIAADRKASMKVCLGDHRAAIGTRKYKDMTTSHAAVTSGRDEEVRM